MAFDNTPKDFKPKSSLKPVEGSPSMFDKKPKPPTQQEFEKKVQEVQEQSSAYKRRAADLFMQFNKTLMDKTLPQNRNVFNIETEKEMLQNMLQLATEINNDSNEQESMGSLTLITLLFKACLAQRDRINQAEYSIDVLSKKIESFPAQINKEIAKVLDSKKSSE